MGDRKALARVLRHLMSRARFTPLPFRVHLDITDRCNNRCPTCSKWKVRGDVPELTADEWRPIFERLRGRVISRRVSLGGGEPLLREDICRVISDLQAMGLKVFLITNGWLLSADRVARLEEAGLDTLMVSLNSLRAEVHDATRGTAGSFRHIMDILPALAGRRFRTGLASIVMNENLEELEGLVQLVQRLGLAGIIFQVLLAEEVHHAFVRAEAPDVPDDWYQRDPHWIRDTAALERVVDRLIRLKRAGAPISNPVGQLRAFKTYYREPAAVARTRCLAGVTSMHIDPYGVVRLCYCKAPIGDLTRDDPVAVWRSAEAKARRKEMNRCTRACRLQNNNY